MILKLYRGLSYLLYPAIVLLLRKRLKQGKEHPERKNERRGYNVVPRPKTKLIWIHGASVGECLSTMPLITRLAKMPNTMVMVTSGTVTSAEVMARRLPKEGAFHQFVPVDYPTFTRRFVQHFHPDVAIFIESDFWPNLLMDTHKAGIPLILLNGRISDRSFKSWQRLPFFIKPLLRLFTLTLGQTEEDARRLRVLGSQRALSVGNIKFAATVSPFDENELTQMRNAIGSRFCWVAGSTHDNEEEQEADIHLKIKAIYPDILTIMAPRHPERADAIEKMLNAKGLTVHRRSRKEDVNADVYIADTVGDMGLVYRLAPLVFVGGSLVAFGGQNMLEPMQAGACTFIGPHAFNFREIVVRAKKACALIEVQNKDELAEQLLSMHDNNKIRQQIAQKGQDFAFSETAVLDRVCDVLKEWIQ